MCGICGILRLRPDAPPIQRDELRRMNDALAHRGPDGDGEWIDPDERLALGHRRLAVIDLSPAGAQPMGWSPQSGSAAGSAAGGRGRYQLVYNGEIYNYRELRRELEAEGATFCSGSDSEVLLALYHHHGTAMLGRLRGMYAFALWDGRESRLLLARDPYGIKPLYYSIDGALDREGGTLRFASELKALEAAAGGGSARQGGGGIDLTPDPEALAGFLLWGSVPEPRTVRRGVRALPAGHHLELRLTSPEETSTVEPAPHFSPIDAALAMGSGGGGTAQVGVVEALEESVRAHLVSDVPVALFLSAGLDSSLLAALARRHLESPPTTFTLRFGPFEGTERDEGPLAAEIARALGTRHVESRVEPEHFQGIWAEALAAMDQPSIDGLNTFVVSRLAREAGLKVVLSGLGGDEIFGSYPSFHQVPRWARRARSLSRLPFAATAWRSLARRMAPGRPKLRELPPLGGSLAGAYYLRRGLFLPEEARQLLTPCFGAEEAARAVAAADPVREAASRLPTDLAAAYPPSGSLDAFRAVHLLESGLYMRNQLLRDADWAAMAHGLEIRVPLVDPQLTRALAAAGFEPARSGGKAAVVRRAAPELPEAVFHRPKSGFGIPVLSLLAGEGAPSGSQGLNSRRLALLVLREKGLLDVDETPMRSPG